MSKKFGTEGMPEWTQQPTQGKTYKRCYESHPPLDVGGRLIYGGSCITPVVNDATIYVGFDQSMRQSTLAYPWEFGNSFLFRIQDGGVPPSVDQTHKLIEWLWNSMMAGNKTHIGCIGGHGRTGLILAALVTHATGEKDSIAYVRENYCKKAVETQEQVDWLHKHFGITKAPASKPNHGNNKAYGYSSYATQATLPWEDKTLAPVTSKLSIWGTNAI